MSSFPSGRACRSRHRIAGDGQRHLPHRRPTLAARFPLQPGDVEATRRWLESEADAARELVGRTRFPTPEPVAHGEPGAGYPLPWSVQTWLPGIVATDEDPGGSAGVRARPGRVHHRGARDRHARPDVRRARSRRRPESHDAWMETCFGHSERLLDVARLRRMWAPCGAAARCGRDVMAHGDLIPGNVLVSAGRLAGILDVGGLGAGDPALDLVAAWHLLEAGPRQVLREDLGMRRPPMGARQGVGFRAGDGRGLVLRRQQPGHEPDGPTHPGPHHHRSMKTLVPAATCAQFGAASTMPSAR